MRAGFLHPGLFALGLAATVATGCTSSSPSEATGASAGQSGSAATDGPGGGGGSSGETVDCDFSIEASLSDDIGTVGIVEWSVQPIDVASAEITFGLAGGQEYSAPVDTAAPHLRTLLLGMKASREYTFRIHARGDDGRGCVSPPQTLTTGPLPTNLPNIEVDTVSPEKVAGGFLVTGTYQGGPVYILDSDGDFVWWQKFGAVARARMSYDGSHMWMMHSRNVSRVAMDGSNLEDLSEQFVGITHDFTVLPDETVIFISQREGARVIVERSPDGTVRDIGDPADAFDPTPQCSANAVHYSPDDDTIVVSEPVHASYVKMSRSGEILWVQGTAASRFSSFSTTEEWEPATHRMHLLGVDRLLFFNNARPDNENGSQVLELQHDFDTMTAETVWQYSPTPPISNQMFGDVQRLENGNTLITFSVQGIVHEVDENGALVQSMSWALGQAIAYTMHRESLYGPPPK